MIKIGIVSLVFCLISAALLRGQSDWVHVGPTAPPEQINAIATNGEGAYVAVGDNGVVHWAKNIDTWQFVQVRNLRGNVTGVVYYKGGWVLGTDRGEIRWSSDGVDWTVQGNSGSITAFAGIQVLDDTLFALSAWRVLRSEDGLVWESVESDFFEAGYQVTDAREFDGRLFVLSYKEGDAESLRLSHSSDGSRWSHVTGFSTSDQRTREFSLANARLALVDGLYAISYNDIFIFVSQDLVAWERPPGFRSRLEDHEYAFEFDGEIVVFGRSYDEHPSPDVPLNSGSYYSIDKDLNIETKGYINPIDVQQAIHSVRMGNFALVYESRYESMSSPSFNVGGRVFVTSNLGTLYSSIDLVNWDCHFKGIDDDLVGVASGDGVVVAVYDTGDILKSYDGIAWKHIDSNFEGSEFQIHFSEGQFTVMSGRDDSYHPI